MTDTSDTPREHPTPSPWHRLATHVVLGAAGATGSAIVTLILNWIQTR